MNYQDGLKQANASLDALAALRAPTTALLGVNQDVHGALASLGLETVFDLATSPLFALAYEIGEAIQGRGLAALRRFDSVPGGAAAEDGPTRLEEFANADIAAIRSLSAQQATELKSALQVDTVGDLGRWTPYRFARLVLEAAGGAGEREADEARELVPKFGEFPTERRYYSSIVMDHVAVQNPVDLTTAGPVDIAPTLEADFGFSAPAVGARLTFEQSWFAHGVTLGNLLHSVALAPGESTRIAVVDWSRQTRASGTEAISETEALTQQTQHNRALSEVQDAVATEVQSGFSHTESSATTMAAGLGGGFSMGPVSLGGSASIGNTKTSADSFSTSVGSRDLSASMSQKVMDATQQSASSSRNRRASLVKEISETEHEQVSTRILANYNHMHALTVQYYEVIELYRVSAGLHEVERCLFVPMKLVDFDERTITRYQDALAAAALDRRAREMLSTDFGMVRLTAAQPMRPLLTEFALRPSLTATLARAVLAAPAPAPPDPAAPPAPPPPPPPPPPPEPDRPRTFAWDIEEVRRVSRLTATNVLRPGRTELLLPREAQLEGVGIALEGAGPVITGVVARPQLGQPEMTLTRTSIGFRMPAPLAFEDLRELAVTTAAGTGRAIGSLTLEVSYRGAFFPVTLPVDVGANATSTIVRIGDSEVGPELVEHLRANVLYYNQAIWRSFNASTVALLLSKFTFEGIQVADLIDPRPIQIAGNYLVFRMPGFLARAGLPLRDDDGATTPEATARRSWSTWLSDRGLTFGRETRTEQLVPIPTGGVFAEAVLGRSNSAEKLDATRFWNWQDSPIPLQPPEIAAINMQSRAQPIDVTPGQLGQPVLNIVNPTALPDPTGLGPMMAALQNGNMFRDMSGLAATIGLARGTASDATSAAAEAGRQASANLAVAAQKDVEQQRIAAQVAMAAIGKPTASPGTPKNISEMGALLNTADKRDQAGLTTPTGGVGGGGGGTSGGGGAIGGGGTPGDAGGGSVDSGGFNGTSGSLGGGGVGDLAVRRALFGEFGAPVADFLLAQNPGKTKPTPPPPPPPKKTDEHYLVAGFDHHPDWVIDTQKEIDAIKSLAWKPSTEDFRALANSVSVSSNTRVTDTLRRFMNSIAFPSIRRHNFYGYNLTPSQPNIIGLAGSIDAQGQITGGSGQSLDGNGLSVQVINALRQFAAQNPQSEEALLLKEARDSHHPEAELWLYVSEFALGADLPQLLATTFKLKVFAFLEPIWFVPEFVETPAPRITNRARIGIGPGPRFTSAAGTETGDPYKFDSKAKAFNP